jgi:uncharacterized protein
MDHRTLIAKRDKNSQLITFFGLAFIISWIFWVPLMLEKLDLISIEFPPYFYVFGGLGPILAAIIMTARNRGKDGVRNLMGRLMIWRVRWYWYAVVLFLPAVIHFLSLIPLLVLDIPFSDFSLTMGVGYWVSLIFSFFILLMEEVGWRGYALPRLQLNNSALNSSIILGLLWGIWHIPLLLAQPERFINDVAPWLVICIYIISTISITIIFTWIFNNTAGSLLLVTLFHAAYNMKGRLYSIETEASFLTFLLTVMAVLILFAVGITFIFGTRNLSHHHRLTLEKNENRPAISL